MWTARGARPWRARVQRRHRPSPPVSQLVAWFHDAGLADARIDAVGNVRGGAGPPAPRATLLLGSHYDTVTDAGAFDGALGLAAALAAVKAVAAAGAAGGCGAPPPAAAWRRRVEVVAFADEEGVRFGTTFLGSGALARGGWAGFGAARDARGASPLDALREAGLAQSLDDVNAVAVDGSSYRGYVEAHAEQGPALERARARVAPVAAIAGQTRLRVTITGQAGHAGTVPMVRRRDAGVAAAAVVVAVEAACGGGPHRGPWPAVVTRALHLAWRTVPATVREAVIAAAAGLFAPPPSLALVCTVGELSFHPGAPNVIPGHALLTVDVRAPADGVRAAALARVRAAVARLCADRRVSCTVATVHEAPASQADPALTAALAAAAAASERGWRRAVAAAGAVWGDPDPGAVAHVGVATVSGAGHDALALAGAMPVRSREIKGGGRVGGLAAADSPEIGSRAVPQPTRIPPSLPSGPCSSCATRPASRTRARNACGRATSVRPLQRWQGSWRIMWEARDRRAHTAKIEGERASVGVGLVAAARPRPHAHPAPPLAPRPARAAPTAPPCTADIAERPRAPSPQWRPPRHPHPLLRPPPSSPSSTIAAPTNRPAATAARRGRRA